MTSTSSPAQQTARQAPQPCDVVPACDVTRSPLPVCVQDGGGAGSERRRRFPKMGRSCLVQQRQQRAGGAGLQCLQSVADGCACAGVTSWTSRDLSHLPTVLRLRDTTV